MRCKVYIEAGFLPNNRKTLDCYGYHYENEFNFTIPTGTQPGIKSLVVEFNFFTPKTQLPNPPFIVKTFEQANPVDSIKYLLDINEKAWYYQSEVPSTIIQSILRDADTTYGEKTTITISSSSGIQYSLSELTIPEEEITFGEGNPPFRFQNYKTG